MGRDKLSHVRRRRRMKSESELKRNQKQKNKTKKIVAICTKLGCGKKIET